jgi:hypothetical protein
MAGHKCSKEVDIELIKQNNAYMCEKIEEIHKILVGNGKPGLVTEFNEIRGALKFTQVFFGLLFAALGILFTVL